ncbi:hypothetical protein Acsp04_22330 [Actinomadura sp. NBRC 104425]|uniref:hypothetical protein n=1 Tax=Actinomadura sp. NBRC 104425 TaxID=3032204 RepID=UPI0024A0F779|nr:hypothetical protein [Actinomadura sp. NBRC 104425]GLZ11998.1 hypothetical protein Acsp04_22330 [Actinomadura sp. NBRC 104425]
MTEVPPIPVLHLEGGWQVAVEDWKRCSGRLRLRDGGVDAGVHVERCAAGRLRDAYPVGARDVEVQVTDAVADEALTALLRELAEAVQRADPECRRVVYAAPEGDADQVAAAECAGFRRVVDVDLADRQLSLLVVEPDWVTRTDIDLDHVPET